MFNPGDKCVINRYNSYHGLRKGTKVDVINYYNETSVIIKTANGTQYTVRASHIDHETTSLECLEADRDRLENELTIIKDKIAFVIENGSATFDENEFRCFQALKIAEDTSRPRLERARALADLMK